MDVLRHIAGRARFGRAHYRAVFLSDTHLGTRGCRTDFLAHFLGSFTTQNLFLVGDIVDGWRLRKTWYWDEMHDEVVQAAPAPRQRSARAGALYPRQPRRDVSRPGCPLGLELGGVTFADEAVHETRDGRRLLIIHGDQFDSVVRYAKFLALLGDWAYTTALYVNRYFNAVRRRLGYPYWSLSQWAKRQVKEAVKAVDRFESALTGEARRRGLDGVVCGHIHHAEMRMIDGMLYLNTGDWVESCTALVEHHDGRLELIDWAALNRLSFFEPRRVRVAQPA